MDSATWHCGGANTSDVPRCVLTISFGKKGAYPLGSTYSIHSDLAGWITLRMLREQGTGSFASTNGSAALLARRPRRAVAGDPTPRPKGPLEAFVAAKAAASSSPDSPGLPDSPKARLADLLAWAGVDEDGDDAPVLDAQLMGRVDTLLALDDEGEIGEDGEDDEDDEDDGLDRGDGLEQRGQRGHRSPLNSDASGLVSPAAASMQSDTRMQSGGHHVAKRLCFEGSLLSIEGPEVSIDAHGHCELPAGMTSVPREAFWHWDGTDGDASQPASQQGQGCKALQSIFIPASVTSIEACAFNMCSALGAVDIPASVTQIGMYAFAYCDALQHVSIPASVTEIEAFAFADCPALKSVIVPSTATIDEDAFYESPTTVTRLTPEVMKVRVARCGGSKRARLSSASLSPNLSTALYSHLVAPSLRHGLDCTSSACGFGCVASSYTGKKGRQSPRVPQTARRVSVISRRSWRTTWRFQAMTQTDIHEPCLG